MTGRCGLALSLALLIAASLAPSAAHAEAPSGSIEPDAGASSPPVASLAPTSDPHAGWVLEQGSAPAFSVLLPPEWEVDATGSDVLDAGMATGEQLRLATIARPTQATFQEYVTATEAALEKATGTSLPTTYRQVGTGLVARIEQPPLGQAPDPTTTTVTYLYPACPDHALTLTLSGTVGEGDTATTDGWDDIAANVDPCSSDPAPVRLISPEVQAVSAAYNALAEEYNPQLTKLYAPLAVGASVKQWNKRMAKMAKVEQGFVDAISALPWTADLQPLADALIAADKDVTAIYRKFAKAKTVKAIEGMFAELDRRAAAGTAASSALRLALGLTTRPQ
jgi:hypothetical protein